MNNSPVPKPFVMSACRICLERSPQSLVPISKNIGENNKICDVIEFCIGVQASTNDSFPQFICSVCLTRLQTAHNLKVIGIQTDKMLKKYREPEVVENIVVAPSFKFGFDESEEEETEDVDESEKNKFESAENLKVEGDQSQQLVDPNNNTKPEHFCKICNESLPNRSALISHRKLRHPELRKHKCPICEKAFSSSPVLKQHIAVQHHKIKKFECAICNRKFGQSGQLKNHRCSGGSSSAAEV